MRFFILFSFLFGVFLSSGNIHAVDPEERFPSTIVDPEDGTKADVKTYTDEKRLLVQTIIETGGTAINVGDFFTDVSRGELTGMSVILKYGYNSSLDNNVNADIWDGNNSYVWATSAERVNIRSSDNDDKTGDTGARTMIIYGLDSSYSEISETINLNGTTNVLSVNSYIRLFRMKILTAGSSGYNEGNITATQNISGILMAQISTGNNQTQMAIYTIPAGKTGYLYRWYYALRTGKATLVTAWIREYNSVFQNKMLVDTDTTGSQIYTFPLKIPEKSDIVMRAIASTGSHAIAGFFDILLVDN